jgi:hypothetical protein
LTSGKFLRDSARHINEEAEMVIIPDDPEARLSRADCANALTAVGYRIKPRSLSTLASRGGGPPFEKFGRYPVYTWGTALAWAKGRLRPAEHRRSSRPHAARESVHP